MSFIEKLERAIEKNGSLLCVGLDPRAEQLSEGATDEEKLVNWAAGIIAQTDDQVCCYKPNFAFFEQFGPQGLSALQRIIQSVPDDIPVLLDVKRGDIGSTAQAYAKAAFEQWGADAVTISPYLGSDSVSPFLAYEGKTAFILCNTSNPSARELQLHGTPPLYEHVAQTAQGWGSSDQIAFVVGATQPQALARVRALCPDNWILAPGVGAQGGDLKQALLAGLRADGRGLIIPVSRGIMQADDPRAAARDFNAQIAAEVADFRQSHPARQSLIDELVGGLFESGCVRFGNFTLASGKNSPIYIDLRRVVSFPALFRLTARFYSEIVVQLDFDRIAGVPYAALPTAAVVAQELGRPFIYPRKEVKTYGTGQAIEGAFEPGQRALILEDVITSGGSIVQSLEVLRQAGLQVNDVVVLVDREQGGAQKMAELGLKLHAVLTISEIMTTLKDNKLIDAATYQSVRDYLDA
ncbi:MAG: uridine monophosphate synthetase [Chloroflexota bacterium]|nr:uridine monophosphate synthetase [Chloroflexota bacterium]